MRRAERELFGRDSDFSFNPQKYANFKTNSTAASSYRGVGESGASHAQQQTGQVRLPGVTGNTPVPSAVNNNGAALASTSVNVAGRQDSQSSSSQAMAATTSNFVHEDANIAQEHVERNAAVKVLQLHHVGGMQSTGSTMQGCLSTGTAVDLTWLLVCVRCEAAVCYSSCTSRI